MAWLNRLTHHGHCICILCGLAFPHLYVMRKHPFPGVFAAYEWLQGSEDLFSELPKHYRTTWVADSSVSLCLFTDGVMFAPFHTILFTSIQLCKRETMLYMREFVISTPAKRISFNLRKYIGIYWNIQTIYLGSYGRHSTRFSQRFNNLYIFNA